MVVVKAFFRFLRGELLDGFYISRLNLLPEKILFLQSIKDEFMYWIKVQFQNALPYYPMRFSDVKGIGQVAGVTDLRGTSGYLVGLFRLTERMEVAGHDYSERGLLKQVEAEFEFFRTDQNVYATDLASIATETMPDALRSPLIPFKMDSNGFPVTDSEDVPLPPDGVGYLWGDASLVPSNLDSNGMALTDKLHDTIPPEGSQGRQAYTKWYGNEYLPLAEAYPMTVIFGPELLYLMIIIQQKIKYNGLGLLYLLEITQMVVPDIISNLDIQIVDNTSAGYPVWRYEMTFDFNRTALSTEDGYGRFAVWEFFLRSKYPYIHYTLDDPI